MEEAWSDIKVLLVPSLWFEAWGIVVIEAHLRGIPVIASDAGALPEAMLGLDYIVPIVPINGERDNDGGYIIPKQDVEPWAEVLSELMSSEIRYEELSAKARNTTAEWVKNLDEASLEKWLAGLWVDSNRSDSPDRCVS